MHATELFACGRVQVSTVKMSEDDFAALEDSQVVVQARLCCLQSGGATALSTRRARCQIDGCMTPARQCKLRRLFSLSARPQPAGPNLLPPPQGLVANRYMNTFREPILDWNRKLNAVADVVQLMSEIQRSWLCEPPAAWIDGCRLGCCDQDRRQLCRHLAGRAAVHHPSAAHATLRLKLAP